MGHLSRREFLAAASAAARLPSIAHAQTPKRGGTLRFIPIGDLKVLDPSLYRKNVRGVLQFPAAVLWNVSMEG